MEHGNVLDLVSLADLCELAEVNRSTAIRWRNGTSRCPVAVLKLAAWWKLGDMAALLGRDWHGWRWNRDGLLYQDGWRSGLGPGDLRAMPYVYAERNTLRTELRRAQAELERLQAELEASERREAWYRRQCTLEARLGLALTRIAG